MQATFSRSVLAQRQIGLIVQLHHHFGLQFFIGTLPPLGFSSTYSEVHRFKRNVAVSQGFLIQDNSNSFILFVGDNVHHNNGFLGGHNAFHGMGMIATITTKSDSKRHVSRQ